MKKRGLKRLTLAKETLHRLEDASVCKEPPAGR